MAVRLARDFRKEGYRLWANIDIKVNGAEPLDRIFALEPAHPSCVIVEGAGLELSDEKRAEAFLDHICSRNVIVLLPSAVPPHELLRGLECHVCRPWRKYLPEQWQPKGLECHWFIPRADYRGSCSTFRWPNPEDVHGLYNPRDPGDRTYIDGYSAFVWRQALRQAVHDWDGPVTIADFDTLVRPGQLFMLCLWLHSQLAYLLALRQASGDEREAFRKDPHY